MRRLIVNADDLGVEDAIDEGILRAHREGIVTAASCVVTTLRFPAAAAAARAHPDLDCGLHLDLTWGRPASEAAAPRLAPGGRFRSKRALAAALLLGRVPEGEILAEARAQVARFRDRLGRPSHVDVHQHFHLFPAVHCAVLDVAREQGIPFVRHPAEPLAGPLAARAVAWAFRRRPPPAPPLRATDHFRGLALTGRLDRARLVALLDSLPPGLTELMVHPGDDGAAGYPDRLSRSRAGERDALIAREVRDALDRLGIRLTTFRAEAGPRSEAPL